MKCPFRKRMIQIIGGGKEEEFLDCLSNECMAFFLRFGDSGPGCLRLEKRKKRNE